MYGDPDNNSNVVVKYQHRFYSLVLKLVHTINLYPESKHIKRQVSYTASGLYMNKETFRMDMDLDIINDSHNDRDWYLENVYGVYGHKEKQQVSAENK